MPDDLIFDPEFQRVLGQFHFIWNVVDLTTDYAICKFLNVTHEQAHIIVSGMMFGKKAKLLVDLVSRSADQKKAEILGAFNYLRNNGKRDAIVHSYIDSKKDTVTFISKNPSGKYKTESLTFTLKEFAAHVAELLIKGRVFHEALGVSNEEFNAFAEAAVKE
jgi:hypothetical protein